MRSSSKKPRFAVTGVFVLGYGVFRTFAEFFREPDAHIGFVAFNWMTKGMQLSIPMILAGVVILYLAYSSNFFDNNLDKKAPGGRSHGARGKA